MFKFNNVLSILAPFGRASALADKANTSPSRVGYRRHLMCKILSKTASMSNVLKNKILTTVNFILGILSLREMMKV